MRNSLLDITRDVLNQSHSIYWDQLNFLIASRRAREASDSDVRRALASLILHGDKNIYFKKACEYSSASRSNQIIRLTFNGPEILTTAQTAKLRESMRFPILESSKATFSLTDVTSMQNAAIVETLLRRQEFGISEGDLWEQVWTTAFTHTSSETIRKAMERIKKTDKLSQLIEIKTVGPRYFAAVSEGSRITFQNSAKG